MRSSGDSAAAALGVLLLFGQASAQSLSGVETRITADASDQYAPSISGSIVTYTDFRGPDLDIYYYDLASHTEHPVTTAPGNQEMSRVSNGLVSYLDLDRRHILVYDVRTGSTVDVSATAGANALDPAIGQHLVAWADDRSGNLEIYARDLATGEERRVTTSSDSDDMPAVDSGVIVWQRCTSFCDIWAYDWATGEARPITNTPDRDERLPAIEGARVVYEGLSSSGDRDIYAFDLSTGEERHLALPANQRRPSVSGDFAAFDDLATGIYHVGLWHIPSGQVFSITGGSSGQYLNDIDRNRVVYTDDRNGQLDIYLYEFQFTPADAKAADCEHLNGAQPLFEATLSRLEKPPFIQSFTFQAPAGPGLLCIENGSGGSPRIAAGVVAFNGMPVVMPGDWLGRWGWWHHGHGARSLLERRVTLEASNALAAWVWGKPGSAAQVRIYPATTPDPPLPPPWHPPGCRTASAALETSAALSGSGGGSGPAGVDAVAGGCSQPGAASPSAAVLLSLAALLGRRALGRAPPRSRR